MSSEAGRSQISWFPLHGHFHFIPRHHITFHHLYEGTGFAFSLKSRPLTKKKKRKGLWKLPSVLSCNEALFTWFRESGRHCRLLLCDISLRERRPRGAVDCLVYHDWWISMSISISLTSSIWSHASTHMRLAEGGKDISQPSSLTKIAVLFSRPSWFCFLELFLKLLPSAWPGGTARSLTFLSYLSWACPTESSELLAQSKWNLPEWWAGKPQHLTCSASQFSSPAPWG